jgi:hypothetical protein
VEAIRALMVAKRTARSERIQTINQARALVLTGPDDIRTRFAKHCRRLIPGAHSSPDAGNKKPVIFFQNL